MKRKKRKIERCSLCGKRLPLDKREWVVGLTGQAVCKRCLSAAKTLQEVHNMPSPAPVQKDGILTPQALVRELDQVIIGQEAAKQAVAVMMWKQQLRAKGDTTVPRSPLLLYGPTGCGKTALIQEAAKLVNLPFISFDCSTLSETGYRGRDAKDILEDLQEMHGKHPNLRYAVILLDEFDKLSARGDPTRATFYRATQHSLLKLMEGAEVATDSGIMRTHNLQFVLGGAFTGLQEIVDRRTRPSRRIGFAQENQMEAITAQPTTEDFLAYGIDPELLGRITRRERLEPLTDRELRRILLDSKISVYRKYQAFFKRHGITLEASGKCIDGWVARATEMASGARGLQTVVEEAMEPLLLRLAEWNGKEVEVWDAHG